LFTLFTPFTPFIPSALSANSAVSLSRSESAARSHDAQDAVVCAGGAAAAVAVARRKVEGAVRTGGDGAEAAVAAQEEALVAEHARGVLRVEDHAHQALPAQAAEEKVAAQRGHPRAAVEGRARRRDGGRVFEER